VGIEPGVCKKANAASLQLPDTTVDLPVMIGTEGERAIDVSYLRSATGWITLDTGYRNTGSCQSSISFIDGEKGILRYRGYAIEDIAAQATFVETALLLIKGELPTASELQGFSAQLTRHELLHEGLRHHFEGFPPTAPPMAILSAMINAIGCYHEEVLQSDDESHYMEAAAQLLSKVRTIAAFSYKKSRGEPIVYPDPSRKYVNNFLHMMFSVPYRDFEPIPELERALQLFLVLHADNEQNCSTSTSRMVASSGASMFASVAAAVCALWGPLHGGANAAVVRMLQSIEEGRETIPSLVEKAKQKRALLWGFGHAVYKNFDPRVELLRRTCDDLLRALGVKDTLLVIARELEAIATHDAFFLERKLYPNVDFYSGILLRAIGIPLNMYPVMFAIGRMPGWIANWHEARMIDKTLYRPRQVYTGPTLRPFIPLAERK